MQIEKLFYDVLNTQSASYHEGRMIAFLRQYCHKKGYKVKIVDSNVYVTKGVSDHYPCYVAHTDTCASIVPHDEFKLYTNGKDLFGGNPKKDEATQVGFDDKIGIFIALRMLDILPAAKAFFPYAEEVGCVGTRKARMGFFNDVTFCIQCDRRNATGVTETISGLSVISKEFKDLLTPIMDTYKRKFVSGMMTDVQYLAAQKVGVSVINVECGYYNPHMDTDYCVIEEVYNTLSFVEQVTLEAGDKVFYHEAKSTWSGYSGGYQGGYAGGYKASEFYKNKHWVDGKWVEKEPQIIKENKTFDDFIDQSNDSYPDWNSIERTGKGAGGYVVSQCESCLESKDVCVDLRSGLDLCDDCAKFINKFHIPA